MIPAKNHARGAQALLVAALRTPNTHALHLPTLRRGRVVEVREPGTHAGMDGRMVGDYVVALSTGDCFLADPERLVALTADEVWAFEGIAANLGEALRMAVASYGAGLDPAMLLLLCRAALDQQRRVLDQAAEDPSPAGGGVPVPGDRNG